MKLYVNYKQNGAYLLINDITIQLLIKRFSQQNTSYHANVKILIIELKITRKVTD